MHQIRLVFPCSYKFGKTNLPQEEDFMIYSQTSEINVEIKEIVKILKRKGHGMLKKFKIL